MRDRRSDLDRRSGLDRRGSGHRTPSPDARPYAFRAFDERRRCQDRRLHYPVDCAAGERREDTPALTISLSHDELRALLRWLSG